jgi:stearoyl-CoA desaturase (delta-9 desaturase)
MRTHKIEWFKSLPFLLLHVSVIAVFWIPFQWKFVAICVASYYLRMFAITAGYHRYFSHRSYKTNRVAQFLLACLGSTAIQKGVLWWAANHRLHHRHSDQPKDIHSPALQGFWWSHVGWILSDAHAETHWDQIRDLAQYPELRWINRYHLIPGILYPVALFIWGGWGAFVWGFLVSTVLLWHGTFTINSLSHVHGTVRYSTTDTSKNNFWLALLTLGEGWHNNHHCYMSSANQGFFWWEIDGSFYVLKALSWIGIVSDLRKPPLKQLEVKRIPSHPRRKKVPLQKHNENYLEHA